MFKICYVTGSRAEYGIMRNLLKKLSVEKNVELDIIVTAMHLEEKYGNTFLEIEKDGHKNIIKIPLNMTNTSNKTIVQSIGKLTSELADVFFRKEYDMVIILGDRYEMLAVANAAVIFNIPICHLHGGEITLGNYDEFFRHAITKMSHIHLTSTEEYRKRVLQLGEEPEHVYNIGALGVENVLATELKEVGQLEEKLAIRHLSDYYVVLFHPVTLKEEKTPHEQIKELLKVLGKQEEQIIFIGSNSDTDSDKIMSEINQFVDNNEDAYVYNSLPSEIYHSLLKYSQGLIGNSSSGLIEVPSLNVPTLNIGNRQKGRVFGKSVIHVSCEETDIKIGIENLKEVSEFSNPYEKHGTALNAIEIILNELNTKIKNEKEFCDLV